MKELHRFRQFLTEGVIKEELKAPSGWTEIKDFYQTYDRSEEDDEGSC